MKKRAKKVIEPFKFSGVTTHQRTMISRMEEQTKYFTAFINKNIPDCPQTRMAKKLLMQATHLLTASVLFYWNEEETSDKKST